MVFCGQSDFICEIWKIKSQKEKSAASVDYSAGQILITKLTKYIEKWNFKISSAANESPHSSVFTPGHGETSFSNDSDSGSESN